MAWCFKHGRITDFQASKEKKLKWRRFVPIQSNKDLNRIFEKILIAKAVKLQFHLEGIW